MRSLSVEVLLRMNTAPSRFTLSAAAMLGRNTGFGFTGAGLGRTGAGAGFGATTGAGFGGGGGGGGGGFEAQAATAMSRSAMESPLDIPTSYSLFKSAMDSTA